MAAVDPLVSQLDDLRWSVDLLDAVAAAAAIGGVPELGLALHPAARVRTLP